MHNKRRFVFVAAAVLPIIMILSGIVLLISYQEYTGSGFWNNGGGSSCGLPPGDAPSINPASYPSSGTKNVAAAISQANSADLVTAASSSSKLTIDTSMFGKSPEFSEQQQLQNADTINKVGLARGLNNKLRALTIATAIQESNLRNLPGGDADSLGLFQQRPSQGWGTASQIMNPVYATNKFIDALLSMTSDSQRQNLSLIQLAEIVQRPDPSAYASRWHWGGLAYTIIGSSNQDPGQGNIPQQVVPETPCGDAPPSTNLQAMLSAAQTQIGTNYVTNAETPGVAFDCSGLTAYAYAAAGIKLPHNALAQYDATKKYLVASSFKDRDKLQKGDLLFFETPIGHVGIYWGDNKLLDASKPGTPVGIRDMGDSSSWYWSNFVGATRPIQTITQLPPGSSSGWTYPLKTRYPISSPYGMRVHPVTGVYKLHDGVDYGAPEGAPIIAAASGVVASAGPTTGYGNYVTISHMGGRVITGYAHMSRIVVQKGQTVAKGQVIGYVGHTGFVTGPHLHFSVRVQGQQTPQCVGNLSRCNGFDDWVNPDQFINNTGGYRDKILGTSPVFAA